MFLRTKIDFSQTCKRPESSSLSVFKHDLGQRSFHRLDVFVSVLFSKEEARTYLPLLLFH